MVRIGPRRREVDRVAGRRRQNLDIREALFIEMAPQRRQEFFPFGALDKTDLAVRVRARRNGVDRMFRVAGLEGQHLEAVPAIDLLRRIEIGLTPVGIDFRCVLTGVDGDVCQQGAGGIRHRFR